MNRKQKHEVAIIRVSIPSELVDKWKHAARLHDLIAGDCETSWKDHFAVYSVIDSETHVDELIEELQIEADKLIEE